MNLSRFAIATSRLLSPRMRGEDDLRQSLKSGEGMAGTCTAECSEAQGPSPVSPSLDHPSPLTRGGEARAAQPRVRFARRAFTLIELLIVIAIVALLIALALPSLRGAIAASRTTKCLSNQRQLGVAWTMYANTYRDLATPAAYWRQEQIGSGPVVYWFGADAPENTPDGAPTSGLLTPFLSAARAERGSLECPEQPAGTYTPQTKHLKFSTTYGYNGYYLTPLMTPGWGDQIGSRPWRRTADIVQPSLLLVFADTILAGASASALPRSSALLDPPLLFSPSTGWSTNGSPTMSFRHAGRQRVSSLAAGVRADGSASASSTSVELLRRDGRGRLLGVGSLSKSPDPWYVPDWQAWRASIH